MAVLASVAPSPPERAARLPGDEIVAAAVVVMDRAFSLPAAPGPVWPWFVQLGKGRGGWYLPRAVERLMPPARRALRSLDPALQRLAVGERIPDWGGRRAYFQVAILDPPHALVHISTRGHIELSWAIALRPEAAGTRVHVRLRLGGVRRPWLARSLGDLVDAL